MELQLRIHGLDADGVRLISPEDPQFDALARPMLGERIADIGLALKPMLVIVDNQSPQTVVAYSTTWHIVRRDGRTEHGWSNASFPESVCGDTRISHEPDALPAGQQRIETSGVVIHRWGYGDQYYDQFLGQFVDQKNSQLANAVSLDIGLNAAIFADGTLAGPDNDSLLSTLFGARVQARQHWYRTILNALGAGATVSEAFTSPDASARERTNQIKAGKWSSRASVEDDCRYDAAAEIGRWRRRFKDEEIPSLLKSIRLEPFEIRRRPARGIASP